MPRPIALQQNARKYKNVWKRRRKPPLTIPMVEVVISLGLVVKSESGCVLGECSGGENKGELILCDVESRRGKGR